MATKIIVCLPNKPEYTVRVGSGLIASLGKDLRAIERFSATQETLVITDSTVAPLYLKQVENSLSSEGFTVNSVVVPEGEESKSVEVASEIWSALAQLAYGRDCLILALGGGVVGDLAGFVASTYMRGVPVVQVPTTLLAMVDSSVGGKTAVNLPEGKNLVGTFFQPSYVCADIETLKTLSDREWQCGCAEIAKSAMIDSDDFFFWLSEHAHDLAIRNDAVTTEAIKRCVVFKANVVSQDETESAGVRECLNFGHTLGHAIEAVAGYGAFSHGAAVAEGIRFALELGRTDNVSDELISACTELLDNLNLPAFSWRASAEDMLEAMKRDKKNRHGTVRFVLLDDIGTWNIEPIDQNRLLKALSLWENATG